MVMVLQANRLRFCVVMLCCVPIGVLTGSMAAGSIENWISFAVSTLISVIFVIVLIPIKKYNVVLKEGVLHIPGAAGLNRQLKFQYHKLILQRAGLVVSAKGV